METKKVKRIKKYIFNNDKNFINDFKTININNLKFLYGGLINIKDDNYQKLINYSHKIQ